MENIHFEFYGFRNKPYINIDGRAIKIGSKWKLRGLSTHLIPGEHVILFCEKQILHRWYWWIMCLNILYPLLCFKGFSGKQAGYDGECLSATFKITCTDQTITNVKLFRQELSWETTSLNANYNSLSLSSNTRILVDSASLDSKRVFRLKLGMMMPFFLTSAIFSLVWITLLIQNNMSSYDIVLSCIIEAIFLSYSTYKIHKIQTQKSFSEFSKKSRIYIFKKNK